MIYLLAGLAVTLWLAAFIFLIFWSIEYGSKVSAFLLFVLIGMTSAFGFWRIDVQNNKGPCLRYETGTHFNPATKSMARYRVCAERGEWIGEFE